MNTSIILSFAGFLALGAFFGWKAGSRISLIMGMVSAILVTGGWLWVRQSPCPGFLFLSIVSAALAVQFYRRFSKTRKWMPSGMLLVITAAFLGFCLIRCFNV